MFRTSILSALLFIASIVASSTFANSVNLGPSGDTTLFESSPDDNTGGNPILGAGANSKLERSHCLLRFNVAGSLPSNASIQSVTLTLTVVKEPGTAPADSTFDLHRVLVDWGEGTGTGSGEGGRPAVTGEATWNRRFHPSTSWSAPGASAPTDFSSTISASQFVQGLASYNFNSTANMVADAKQWLSNPSTNFGWILTSESEATPKSLRYFGSRENSTATSRPVLSVQYVIPVTPTIKAIQKVNGTIQFSFAALAGQPYTAEYRDSLTGGTWSTLTNVSAQPSNTDVTVTDPAPPSIQRFYRVTTTF